MKGLFSIVTRHIAEGLKEGGAYSFNGLEEQGKRTSELVGAWALDVDLQRCSVARGGNLCNN